MTYNFRYSRFAPSGILNIIFIGLLWIIGILLSIVILFYIINYRILRTSEATFWKQHQKFVLYLIFILPITFVIIFSIIGSIIFRHFIDAKNGVLNIFNNYATLYYKGKEITLEKGNFSISSYIMSIKGFQPAICVYIIKTENKKYKIYGSSQEAYELTSFSQRRKGIYSELSLDIAIKELTKLANTKNDKIKSEVFYIGDVQIILNVSTLEVFESTDYFVDIENALPIEGVPFIVCDIYENKNSEHLIGEVGIIDDEKNDKLPSVEELKKRVIVSGLELDEYMKNRL